TRMAEFAAKYFASPEGGIDPAPEYIEFQNGHIFDRRTPQKKISFGELANIAYHDRVDLGARGFYRTPGVNFNRETCKGNPFYYFTNGAAVAEVLIDKFTGDLKVERVDMLMDIGVAINPGIDRGQVTSGFIQGMGWVTAEE